MNKKALHTRTTLAAFLMSALTFSSNSVLAEDCPAPPQPLEIGELEVIEFDRSHSVTLQSTVAMLSKGHYEKISLDDTFSSQWLEDYIEFLDPAKSYLLKSDIENFERSYSSQLDDYTRKGDLSPADTIYELYRDRAISQIEKNLARLSDIEHYSFNYTTDKSLPTKREDYNWSETVEAADERSERQLTLSMLNLKLSDVEDADAREQLSRRYKNQLSSLSQQKTQQVLDLYLNAMGHIYDPHTDYFSPRQSENFEINMSLSLEGIGAVLQTEDEFTKVVSVVPGGPAQLEGQLQAADKIIGIGEGEKCEFVDVVGWRLDEVVDRIRGAKGTSIRLKVIPAKLDELGSENVVIKIVRDKVKLEDNAAKGEVIEIEDGNITYNLGVIDIPSFYLDINAMMNRDPEFRSTTRDVKNILDDFSEQGIDGVIIDLRQNGGGSLLESATLTDLFVDPGPVVQIRDQDNRIYRNHRARDEAYYSGPLMVLTDRLSASASEIFAGAIQDYGRGLVVGSQTFGKGTVQSVQDLPSGKLKLTESKFYRISGESTQHKGVIPDISLPGLFNPDDIGESSYDNALEWDQIRGIPHRRYENYQTYLAALVKDHKARLKSDADLRYLQETIALSAERRGQESISLNEDVRIAQRELWKTREDELKQTWATAKGIVLDDEKEDTLDGDVAKDTDTEISEDLAVQEVADVDATEEDPNEPNVAKTILYESGRIFTDLLKITQENKSLAQVSN